MMDALILFQQKLERRKKAFDAKKEEWTPTSRIYLQDCLRLDMTSPEKTDEKEEGKRVPLPFAWESSRLCKGKESLDRIFRDNVLTTPAARRQLAFVSDGPEDTRTPPPQNCPVWAISREYAAV